MSGVVGASAMSAMSAVPPRHRRLRLGLPGWGLDLRGVRWAMGAGAGFSALRAVLQWLAPVPLKLIFDNVLAHHRLPAVLAWLPSDQNLRLVLLCLSMVAIAGLLGLTGYAATVLLAGAGQRAVFGLRCRLFDHLQAQSSRFHQNRPVGDLLSRLGSDVQAIQSVVVNVLPVAVENSLTVLGMIAIMFVLDWQFGLLALALLPGLWWVVRHYMAAIKAAQREAQVNEGLATSAAQQTLVALPVVQAFGTQALESDRYAALAGNGLAASRRAVIMQARFTPLVTAIMTLATALVMLFGAREVTRGRLTAGDLLVFSAYFRGMYSPTRQLAKLAGTLGRGQASAERIAEILATQDHVRQRPDPVRPRRVRGEITFEQVSVAHPGSDLVLKQVELSVPAGQSLALVGATGSGKSTLLLLVPRFLDPERGVVRLDGVDLRDLDLTWLRQRIAFVPQEMALLRPTVWENVVYGTARASRADAVAAAKAVGVHEVLAGLRNGYDTEIGERGTQLSGGQRQCVAMARAMVRDAPVLLLDEPTTGLDPGTEAVVLAALERLCQGRTTLMVTHRMAAAHSADIIAVLAGGRIVERGVHADLVRTEGVYRRLHQPSGRLAGAAHPVSSLGPMGPARPEHAWAPTQSAS